MSDGDPLGVSRDLTRWSETLAAIARTGLGFTQSLYERERYQEVLHVAADIRAAALEAEVADRERFVTEWMASVGEGVPGYVTPKCSVGAIVSNDAGEILLVQRPQSGYWLFPTGWADVGYSPAEVVVKEVFEETGIRCQPSQLLSVVDGQQMGISRFAMYLMVFPLHGDRRRTDAASAGDCRCRLVRPGRDARTNCGSHLVGRSGLSRHRRRAVGDGVRCAPRRGVAVDRRSGLVAALIA